MVLLLMPGMDGTGLLFRSLQAALGPGVRTEIVTYPRDRVLGYDDLFAELRLPEEPYVIVAESFSGALAIRMAASASALLRGVILAATFVRRPRALPPALISLLSTFIFRVKPPATVLRRMLLDAAASDDEVATLQRVIHGVHPSVLRGRLQAVMQVDVSGELRRCRVPMLHITAQHDRLIPAHETAAMHRLLPTMQRVTLEGPHLILQRRPHEAAGVMTRFIESLESEPR